MATGDILPSESREFTDPQTGVRIRQLTDYRAHNHHLYFTNNGFWDDGRRLIVASHRNNAENFYSVELDSGEITQLTDFPSDAHPRLQPAFLNPIRDEIYFMNAAELIALDLRSCQQRVLYRRPDEYMRGALSCTADGAMVCLGISEDLSDRIRMDLGHGYVGFAEYSDARPHSQIVGIPVDGGPCRILHEEDFWLTHINTSPALPNTLTFCHEGPWKDIDQRMWVLDIASGDVHPLRPQKPNEAIGHEYWFADGERIGYHGTVDGVARFGYIRPDNSDHHEWDFPHGSFHFHSMDETLIVGDGLKPDPRMFLWKLEGNAYGPTRVLLHHRCSFHDQILHVHPRMFAGSDGSRRIVFSADTTGYGNVYIADIPDDVDSLPPADSEQ
ncbi:MAG: oligogalacturonate lyase family protein [Phycisphaerae bacterium]